MWFKGISSRLAYHKDWRRRKSKSHRLQRPHCPQNNHSSIIFSLSRIKSRWQQAKQGMGDLILPGSSGSRPSLPGHPGEIQTRWPNQLNRLLLHGCSSTPSSPWMTELLTLSLRLSPVTLLRKNVSAACVHNLIFGSLPKAYDHRRGLVRRLTGKSRASHTGSAPSSP